VEKNRRKKIALNSMTRLPRLVIDENHATDLSAPKGGSSPAMGWMTGLRAEADGSIHADVAWTKRGEAAILNREYSFISPVFLHDDAGEITVVLRAGLTNSPNLQLPVLNSEKNIFENKTDTEDTMDEDLAAIKALNAAMPKTSPPPPGVDLTAYAPRADLNAMEARAMNAALLKKDAEAAVDDAIKACKIVPANRDEYVAFCSTEEGLEKMKNIFAKTPAIIGEGEQAPVGAPPSGGTAALNAEESALAKAMGYTEEEFRSIKGDGK